MLTNADCTLYVFNGIGYDRYYIPTVMWQENRASNVLKSGLQTADSITVYVPAKVIVIAPNNQLYPADKLFPDMKILPKNTSKDMLVKGACEFVFNNESQKTVSDSMSKFRVSNPGFVTVTSIDTKLYGLKELQHIKISAK